MIRSVNGKAPKIAKSAWVSEAAYVVGNVEIGENTSVWPGAVIRGDFESIKIGANCAIEDNCVIHSGSPIPGEQGLEIGDRVIVGHGAVIHCRRIGNNVLIGMNATVLNDAEIGSMCIIGAGSLVSPKMKIPANSLVWGSPAEIKGAPTASQLRWVEEMKSDEGYNLITKLYREQGL